MTLYEIRRAVEKAVNSIYADAELNEGIIPEDAIEKLNKLRVKFTEKVGNIACLIKSQEALAAAIKAEEQELALRRKTLEKRSKWLKDYLSTVVTDKLETARAKISFRKSESVIIRDEEKLPKKYIVEKITYTPNKVMIKDAIKFGEVVDGAELVINRNIQIK